MKIEGTTEEIIRKLLGLRLTKFQYGFVLGLKGHEPTKEQRDILLGIANRYPAVFAPTTTIEPKEYNEIKYHASH